jgi:hypothetical protein
MKAVFTYLVVLLLVSCIEPYDVKSVQLDAEGALIVEATLTNELKQQKILLSRPADFAVVNVEDSIYDPVYPLRPRVPNIVFERNATVLVRDASGNVYRFTESSPGAYLSETAFAAQLGVGYRMTVVTADGTSYVSTEESYGSVAEIDAVYAVREFNSLGDEGVTIYLDARGNDQESKYYRYTFDESYKIIAPSWQPQDFKLTNYDPCALPTITYDLEIFSRDQEEGKVCYGKQSSSAIIQTTTLDLQENTITRFPIRFLDRENYIISHRYSILVKQYVQSQNAYNFYKTLNNFSSNKSIFSSVQPGILEGNVRVESGENKNVLGFFEVAAVVEKRMFFNYADLFPNEPLPEFAIPCIPWSPPLEHTSYCFTGMLGGLCPLSIVESVNINLISYFDLNTEGVGSCPGPYLVNYRACGDCTVLGASTAPDFWTD